MTSYPYRPFVVLSVALCIIAILALSAQPAQAGGMVTECTDADLTRALASGGTVTFDCPGLSPHTIAITAVKTITAPTRIEGNGEIVLDGLIRNRIFMVEQSASLDINGLTLTRGFASTGGAIANNGLVTLTNCILSHNVTSYGAYLYGGGVANWNTLIIRRSLFEANSAPMGGGGVFNATSGYVSIEDSIFISNTAPASGYFNGNSGGLYNTGAVFITNSTFISNASTTGGGGVATSNHIVIINSTFNGNAPNNIANTAYGAVTNTIFTSGTSENCISSAFIGSNNLSSDASCTFTGTDNQISTDPQLGPLVYFGVGVPTYSLLPGSPAIDAGTNAGCPATDQRGFARPFGARCDIGAFEWTAPFANAWHVPIFLR
jgi:hypothetical protein